MTPRQTELVNAELGEGHTDDNPHPLDVRAAMVAEVRRLRAIVDKLPKYADTGSAITPGMDLYYWRSSYSDVDRYRTEFGYTGPYFQPFPLDGGRKFYSTEQAARDAGAALAARKGSQ